MTRPVTFAGVFLISFSAIWVRLAAVPPATAALLRQGYALPLLAILWLAVRGRDQRSPASRRMAMVAGAFLGIDLWFWHRAIEHIGAGLATVLGNTQVVFVGFAAWLLLGERPTRLARWVVPGVFLGVALVSGLGRAEAYGDDPLAGVGYGLLTGMSYAVFLLLLRRSNRELAPAAGPMLDATFGGTLAAALLGLVDGSFLAPGAQLAWIWPAHGWLLALALGSQVLGWLLVSRGLPRLAALESSVILLTQPVLTLLWARLIFQERLSWIQLSGAALVLLGVSVLSVVGSVDASRKVEAALERPQEAA